MLIAANLCALIRLHKVASTEVAAGVITRPDSIAAVSKSGVLQGGELAGGEESPVFVVQAEQIRVARLCSACRSSKVGMPVAANRKRYSISPAVMN